jgi:hypothetical protein
MHKIFYRVTQICNFSDTHITIFNIVICILINFCNYVITHYNRIYLKFVIYVSKFLHRPHVYNYALINS